MVKHEDATWLLSYISFLYFEGSISSKIQEYHHAKTLLSGWCKFACQIWKVTFLKLKLVQILLAPASKYTDLPSVSKNKAKSCLFKAPFCTWNVFFPCLCKLHYPANIWGVRGGGRLSLSTLLASIAETVRGAICRGYFSRMSFTSRWTPSGQERRSACMLWAASISASCRLLSPDSSSRLWLSWARTGLVAVTPSAGSVWSQSPSELWNRGEAWPDM